jgi:hypothetical protein
MVSVDDEGLIQQHDGVCVAQKNKIVRPGFEGHSTIYKQEKQFAIDHFFKENRSFAETKTRIQKN